MKLGLSFGVAAGALLSLAAMPAQAVDINLEEVATGLTAPLAMVQPDGDDRKFIIEQPGFIRIMLADGTLLDEPFLDIRYKIVTLNPDFDERGLLGLAFHPDFANNGKFYVAYSGYTQDETDVAKRLWWDHTNYVAEFTVSEDDPNTADRSTERTVSAIDWPQFNHNGHWIGFGPDGMLYISTGDGGYANDWGIGHEPAMGNGQDMLSLHGKMLRIDVDQANGAAYGIPEDNPYVGQEASVLPEIYASGLRNPWRCSFDMGGDNALFCGDVQQNSYEEVSVIGSGANLGWRVMEATQCFDYLNPNDHPTECESGDMVPPIIEYENCTAKPEGCQGISVTGGYVYRGSHADWDGKYIFGDWSKSFAAMDGQIFIATDNGDGTWSHEVANVTNLDGATPYILAFAQDADGEVYALTSLTTGPVGGLDSIYRITPAQ